jgi:hypothetical protein
LHQAAPRSATRGNVLLRWLACERTVLGPRDAIECLVELLCADNREADNARTELISALGAALLARFAHSKGLELAELDALIDEAGGQALEAVEALVELASLSRDAPPHSAIDRPPD